MEYVIPINEERADFDVAIIGGGPAGATAATLLRKYDPSLSVVVLEADTFPRDHVGESQLPAISNILDEMGAWDKVEAANFPIKIGSTNRWGKNPELWDFEFFPTEEFVDEPRPAKYEGQRRFTAFQVDRAIYDDILLQHAADMGAEVRQATKVVKVDREGDRVTGLHTANGTVTARHYVDASGHSGILRRAMGVETECPTSLQNIALYDYWENTEWAVKIGVGGTKVQVMSLGYGWIWFIPLGPTRTSIGLIVPAEYYKQCKKKPEELYLEALASEERISALTANAKREGKFRTTKDWSFLSSRQWGENWFLIGESAGFADPILAAGMTMAHAAGRELAYTILELERGETDAAWLKEQFGKRQTSRIVSHIRFADFWYTSNAQFCDIKEHTQQIAKDVGLDLSPDRAWQWLAQGGFIDEDLSSGIGGFSLFAVKGLGNVLTDIDAEFPFEKYNSFRLNLNGASYHERAIYREGRIRPGQSYSRGNRVLPVDGPYEVIVNLLQRSSDMEEILKRLNEGLARDYADPATRGSAFTAAVQAFEALIADGWVETSFNPDRPRFKITYRGTTIRLNRETLKSS